MIDINPDRAIPLRWEYAAQKEGKHSVLIVERGNGLLVGYDVPSPEDSYDEAKLSPYELPAGMTLGPELSYKLLQGHIERLPGDPCARLS